MPPRCQARERLPRRWLFEMQCTVDSSTSGLVRVSRPRMPDHCGLCCLP